MSAQLEDARCSVERILKSTLAESDCILPRERWIATLQRIGVSDHDSNALLKDQASNLGVEEFLKLIFGEPDAEKVDDKMTGVTDNLQTYFEQQYLRGGEFHHPEYVDTGNLELHTWGHVPTGIEIWRDAIDLTSGEGGEVYFHYTSELAFRNITAPHKKAAEVWASLNSEPGPNQNAWWGKGVYSVPLPPDQWQDRQQLLDNNFRNMMARDRAAPDKGPEYVQAEYPKRVAFCVPIIIDAADAYDISVRATPEMQAAGKEPGRNLGDKLLNEPGMPPRCCVVLRVNGEDGVRHAQGQLLDALRRRADSSTDPGAKERLGDVLMKRGLYTEALQVLPEVLSIYGSKHGPESGEALVSMGNLAALLHQMGRYGEAAELQRRMLRVWEERLGEHQVTFIAMNNLAGSLQQMGDYPEAMNLYRKAYEIGMKILGAEHPDTLRSMSNLGLVLTDMGKHHEAAEIAKKALEIKKKTLGAEHPSTLASMTNLGTTIDKMGHHQEAVELLRRALGIMERTLGPEHPYSLETMTTLGTALRNLGNFTEAVNLHTRSLAVRERTLGVDHPDTLLSLTELAVTLHRKGELDEAMEIQRRAVSGREKILGPDHPDTKESRKRLEEVLQDLSLKEVEDDKPS